MDLPANPALRLLRRLRAHRKAASGVDYAVLAGLVAVAVLGAVVLTGDRVRSLFVASEETVTGGIAGLPLPEPGGGAGAGGQPPPAAGQGTWSGDGAFLLAPGSTPQTRAFTVTNVGTDLLVLGTPAVSGPGAPAFDVLSSDCGALPPGDSCQVLVQASAGANGTATATLSIGGVPGGLPLSYVASGFNPALAWSGSGAFVIDGTPGPEPLPRTGQTTLTLENQGFADATGVAPVLTGPDAGIFSLTTDCPPVLPQGAVCTVTVTAAASDNGPLAATLSSGGATPATQPLSATATGFAPTFAWSGGSAFTLTAPMGNPTSVERTFTLTNTGTLAGAPAVPTVSGDGAGYAFSLVSTTCDTALPVGGTCQATVRATFTDNVPAAAGTLSSGAASQPLAGSASGFVAALAWVTLPEAQTLNVANGGVTQPDTIIPGPVGTATLRNTGTLPADSLTVALAGPDAASFEITADACSGQTLAPGTDCTLSVRLRAGLFPADYALQLSATATGLAATDSAQTSQRVVGPHLQITGDNLADVSHTGEFVGTVRIFQVTNTGNVATPDMEVAGNGLIRSDFNNIAEGRGFLWNLYDSANVVFPSGVLDSYDRPSTNAGRLRSVPAGGGLVLHVGLGWADLLGNPTPPANYTTNVQLDFSTGGSLVLTPGMSATCGSPCRY